MEAMDWAGIRKLATWLPESSDGWSQHAKGGGWVHDSATVPQNTVVPDTTVVGKRVTLGNGVRLGERVTLVKRVMIGHGVTIGDDATVGNRVILFNYARLGDGVTLGDDATLGTNVTIGNRVTIGDDVTIGSGVTIGDDETLQVTPIYILGTRYFIACVGRDLIQSGCITKPLAWWLENVESCARQHNYTPRQQREYRGHIDAIAAWMKLHGMITEEGE